MERLVKTIGDEMHKEMEKKKYKGDLDTFFRDNIEHFIAKNVMDRLVKTIGKEMNKEMKKKRKKYKGDMNAFLWDNLERIIAKSVVNNIKWLEANRPFGFRIESIISTNEKQNELTGIIPMKIYEVENDMIDLKVGDEYKFNCDHYRLITPEYITHYFTCLPEKV